MGDSVATAENGYERISQLIDKVDYVSLHLQRLSYGVVDDIPGLTLDALCADFSALARRLDLFRAQYKEQLECISIDQ